MEQVRTEYAGWIQDEDETDGQDPVAELLRLRKEEAGAPLKTWMVPVVSDMDRCIRERFFPRILREAEDRLVRGELSLLLDREVVPDRLLPRDLTVAGISYWRLNRSDFLADVDLTVSLTVAENNRQVPERFGLCMSLWFTTEEGFGFEVQGLCRREEKPERGFWRLDRFLVPVIRDDEIESGADRLWADCLPGITDPRERTPDMLAEKLGLSVRELRLHGRSRTRGCLLFQDTVVSVQEESVAGSGVFPDPVPVNVAAGTILLNTAARTESRDLDVLHECIHYEWHLLFYRLQKLLSTDPLEIRCKPVQTTAARSPRDPLRWIERQARGGSLALLLPLDLMRGRAWKLYQQSAASPAANGWLNHPGFRWDRVIRRLSDEYRVCRTTVRRRLVGLGHSAARGAVNFVDGRYITPFAFTAEHSPGGRDTLVIGRKALADLYHRSREFRELMGRGDFVYADGHVCMNDPQYLRPTPDGARLTPWANAHADACCLRFEKVYLRDGGEAVWLFGSLDSSEDYIREYDRFLDRRMSLTARERMARRNQLMLKMPHTFPDALRYLMENRAEGRITIEELAALARVSRKTVERYRSPAFSSWSPDVVVALCVALHLPPWLSRLMLEKAGFHVTSYGPRGHYGEILDCCFMDTVPEVQDYLRAAGYPLLRLQES